MTAKVDVIIPAYNALPYLRDAVESVLAQTHRDLTLIVVDDGSTDDTADYVASVDDSRVQYVRKQNGGQAGARNLGIRRSSSPYIGLLDGDDVWYPHKVAMQLQVIKQNVGVGLVHGYQHTIDERGNIVGSIEKDLRGHVFDQLLCGNVVTGSGSMVLVRREVFEHVGLFREDLRIGEDWDMWLRIARMYAFDYVPEYLAALRVRTQSLQADQLKMADGRSYMFPVVARELGLRGRHRARFAVACLMPAAFDYTHGGARWRAWRTLAQVAVENPPAFLRAMLRNRLAALRFFLGLSRPRQEATP